ncbi:penicillin-binding protein 1A [Kistimonas scapharcae]|uniref:Penicillin-binding protein 1A n=1 Tax=Kistimonas scapharcae TaxID=1036133 RepID=A0ABP8UX02_9GAMM
MKTAVKLAKFGLWCGIAAFCGALLISASVFLYLSPALPSVDSLRDIRLQTPLRVFSADNKLIAEFGEKRRSPIQYEDLPRPLIKAFLAAEDDRFYSHNGVDVMGLLRATVQLVSTGKIQSGGSTITMQVAKNLFLSHERVFSRKFNEILLALEIERKLSKNEILELYLNKIYLGNRAYGVEAAAQVYYGKPSRELTLAEMAMIAGLPKAPSRYNPLANPRRALIRRDWILSRMYDLGYITQADMQSAIEQPVTAQYHGLPIELEAPYVAEMVRQEIVEQFGQEAYTDGYEIYTTVNSNNQVAANKAIDNGIQAYDERHGYRGPEAQLGDSPDNWHQALMSTGRIGQLKPAIVTAFNGDSTEILFKKGETAQLPWTGIEWARPYITVNRQGPKPKKPEDILAVGDLIRVRQQPDGSYRLSQIPDVQAALVAISPKNGAIEALVGGFNFYDSKYNRVTQASRQAGSAFKPFVYSAAIANGMTAATLINDAPIVFSDDKLESHWRPQNDNMKFYGPTRLRKGLYRSRNLVSIRVLQRTGIQRTIDYMEKLGLPRDKLPRNLSLSLGSADLTPLELTTSYAILANGGFRVEPHLIQRIDRLEKTVFQANPPTACRDCADIHKSQPDAEQAISDLMPNETLSPSIASTINDFALMSALPTSAPFTINYAERVMGERVNYIINSIMQDVIRKGTGRRALALTRDDLAGKTGTTNDQKDVWFAGYNPDLLATVWLGFDQPRPLGRWEYGANAALPMWVEFMRTALKDVPESYLPQPAGITTIKINPETGKPARPDDPNAIFEIFRTEKAPKADFSDEQMPTLETETFNPDEIF